MTALQSAAPGPEAGEEDSREDRVGRQLRAHGEESGDGRRRAFVHVRRPDVERSGRDLEEEPAGREDDPHDEKRRLVIDDHRPRNAVERERPRRPVHERHPVQEDAGGERPEDEVLRGRFQRLRLAFEVAREDVLRQRHQLERDVDRRQVRAGRHEEHPDRREEDQAVVLASRVRRNPHEPEGKEDRDDRREDHEPLEVEREAVHGEHAAESDPRQHVRGHRGDARRSPVTASEAMERAAMRPSSSRLTNVA